jgi:hypothetical protein
VLLEADPSVDAAVLAALVPALRGAGLLDEEDARPEPWRRAAVAEAVDPDDPALDDYAFSPRSTRGATRA